MRKGEDGERHTSAVENISKNWLAQCKELGEVEVEEVDSTGYKCFEEGGEKLYRIWLRMDATKEDDLF